MSNQCITTAGRTHQNFPPPHPTTKLFKSTVSLKWRYIYLNTLMGARGRCKMMICVPYYQLGSVISSYMCSLSFGRTFYEVTREAGGDAASMIDSNTLSPASAYHD